MKAVLSFCLILITVKRAKGIKCMTCIGSSIDECDSVGQIQDCMPNQKSCETVVRRYGDHMSVSKGCKDRRACRNNQMQNTRYSGRSSQCNLDQSNSFCTCCCSAEFCNIGFPTCASFHTLGGAVPHCLQVPANFPHGKVDCYNDNKAGSVCEYQCTGKDYSVWPKGQETIVCLGNGTWSRKRPCCARPCPPYYLLDNVYLYHVGGENPEARFNRFRERIIWPKIADDAILISALYYSDKPVESSVIKFNEYGANASRLLKLAHERLSVVQGPPNTGAAIQYAVKYLFKREAGMRDSRVPKAIFVFLVNADPADDAREASAEARRLGIQVYVMAYGLDGYNYDRKKLAAVTGDEKHVFVFDRETGNLSPEDIRELNNHFCVNPCDHVLHDHE